jgi:GNAT superfamily N-acetyltransferase
VIAYVDGEPAGWCSIAPRSSYGRLTRSRTIPRVDDRDPWAVVCFVVRVGFRKRGLMHDLLDGAVEHARNHGAEVVEGYPPTQVAVASTSAAAMSGPSPCSSSTGSSGLYRPLATAVISRDG